MDSIALLITCMLANRFRGGGIIEGNIPARRWIAAIVIGAVSAWVAGNWLVLPIIALGYWFANLTGTGDCCLVAITGRFDGQVKYNLLNRWYYAISGEPTTKNKAAIATALRGLYRVIPMAGIAMALHEPIIACMGLLGVFHGAIVRFVGLFPETRYSNVLAELLDGALWAVIIGGGIWVSV